MGEVTLNQKVEKIFEEQIYFDDHGIRSNDSERITENIRKVNTRIRQAEKARYNLDNWINEYELDPDIRLQDKEEQKEVALNILGELQDNDNVILEAPTGWGKTGLAYQIYKQSGKRVLVLNHSNVLLNQYIDLLEKNLKDESVSLMGKSNYNCYQSCEKMVSTAECSEKCIWKSFPTCYCEYYWRKFKSSQRKLVISNYHQQFLSDPEPYDIVVCDECHNIEKIMVDFYTVEMSKSIIDNLKDEVAKIKLNEEEKSMLESIFNVMERCLLISSETNYEDVFRTYYGKIIEIKNMFSIENGIVKEPALGELIKELIDPYETYDSQNRKDNYYGGIVYSNYVYEENQSTQTFKLVPLFISEAFKKKINKLAPKRVYMSATVINHENMIEDLGMEKDKTKYIELQSKIPKESRLIFSVPVAKLSMKETDDVIENSEEFKNLCDKIVDILSAHESEGESGFIYCNSYRLSNLIYKGIVGRTGYEILINSNTGETKEVLNRFLDTSKKNRLLISCSFAEGVNFNDDISRFQIIPKIPYLFLGSKRIALKNKLNNRWYTNKAIEQIIQVAGRSVRSPQDNAVTYILDSAFSWCYKKYEQDYPTWFTEAINRL